MNPTEKDLREAVLRYARVRRRFTEVHAAFSRKEITPLEMGIAADAMLTIEEDLFRLAAQIEPQPELEGAEQK